MEVDDAEGLPTDVHRPSEGLTRGEGCDIHRPSEELEGRGVRMHLRVAAEVPQDPEVDLGSPRDRKRSVRLDDLGTGTEDFLGCRIRSERDDARDRALPEWCRTECRQGYLHGDQECERDGYEDQENPEGRATPPERSRASCPRFGTAGCGLSHIRLLAQMPACGASNPSYSAM